MSGESRVAAIRTSGAHSFIIGGHVFHLRGQAAAAAFLQSVFDASSNRKALYDDMIQSSSSVLLSGAMNREAWEHHGISTAQGCTLLCTTYGPIYDPEQELFSVEIVDVES